MKSRTTYTCALLCILMVVISACDAQTPPPPTLQPLPTHADPNPAPGSGTTLTYVTTGGIAGVRRELYISPEGFATLTDGDQVFGPVTLPQQRMVDLKAKLNASNFGELSERYGTGNVADDFLHTLTVEEGGSAKSVTVEEVGGKDTAPQGVQELFAFLGEIEDGMRSLAVASPTTPPGSYRGTITFKSTREVNGQNWVMTITERGEATLTDSGKALGTVQLAPEQMEQIEARLEAANFFNLKVYYGSGHPHPNERVDTITIKTPTRTKVVTVERSAGFTQATVQVRELFQELVDTYAGARTQIEGTPTSTP